MTEKSITQLASEAIRMFDMYNAGQREPSIKKCSAFGIALKYILWDRKISFCTASKMLGYKNAQGFNYLVNQRSEKNFYREELTFVCAKLSIDEDFFLNLSAEIKKQMVECRWIRF